METRVSLKREMLKETAKASNKAPNRNRTITFLCSTFADNSYPKDSFPVCYMLHIPYKQDSVTQQHLRYSIANTFSCPFVH